MQGTISPELLMFLSSREARAAVRKSRTTREPVNVKVGTTLFAVAHAVDGRVRVTALSKNGIRSDKKSPSPKLPFTASR
jgi:hypothetical protein